MEEEGLRALFATKGAANDGTAFGLEELVCNKRECGLSFETGERFIINDNLVDRV